MFDVGFSELMLIGLIALVVVGPERLPPMIRSVGRWLGRAQRMVREMRTQFDNDPSVRELTQFQHTMRAADITKLPDETPKPPSTTGGQT